MAQSVGVSQMKNNRPMLGKGVSQLKTLGWDGAEVVLGGLVPKPQGHCPSVQNELVYFCNEFSLSLFAFQKNKNMG